MTAPVAAEQAGRPGDPRGGPLGGLRRSALPGFDVVGGTRLTGFGGLLLAVVVIGSVAPPRTADRQIMALVAAAVLAVLAVGVVWPLVSIRRITVAATSPRDAFVGDQVPIEIVVGGRRSPCEVRALDPTGPWRRVSGPGEGTLEHLADRRGVFGLLRVEVRVTAPLGVLAAHRVHAVALPYAVEVAPRPLAVDWVAAPAPLEGGTTQVSPRSLGGDLTRSVRPYAAGDPAHLVHWPSSARAGSLVVRELEPPSPTGQALVVDLTGLGADTERAAAYALGAARAVLAAGGDLIMCTAEPSGPVTGRVRAPIDAGRRIARAVPGPPGAPPKGWPVVEIGR